MAAIAVKGSRELLLLWPEDWAVNAIGVALATLLRKAAISIRKMLNEGRHRTDSTTRQTGFPPDSKTDHYSLLDASSTI